MIFGCDYWLIDSSIKIEKFIVDFIDYVTKNSSISKGNYIYNILINYSRNSENNIFDKKMVKLYFANEQFDEVKLNQKRLGYENNFSRFVRCALFDNFMEEHKVIFIELIDYDKFSLLLDRCKYELLQGNYTSYDLDLLRDNKKYENNISVYAFDNFRKEQPFNFDFLEYDMLSFVVSKVSSGKTYSELEGLSTKQSSNDEFLEMEDEEVLEPFTDYDNIVPDTDSFYYLFLYYAFIIDPGELDIDEIFNETDEHIELLLKKYTFEKIIRYYKQKYNITDIDKIFDKKCIESLRSDSVIEFDKDSELDDIGT